MQTVEYAGPPLPLRSHPWTDATGNSKFRYYDLIGSPALIRTALEDLLPWQHTDAIERFYTLLEWINGIGGPVESNDCEFTGPSPNPYPHVAATQVCSGRIMLLFRDLAQNVPSAAMPTLAQQLHRALAPIDPSFVPGMVSTTIVPVRFLAVPSPTANTSSTQVGSQLMISFWAWGNSDEETFRNLDRTLQNLTVALRTVTQRYMPLALTTAAT
jgi:hypothetical protein